MQLGAPRFAVRVFDGVRIGNDAVGALPPARRQLLAILVAAGPRGLSVDKAADQLWGEDLPSAWNAAFRMGLSRLRGDIGEDVIVNQGGHCQLVLPPTVVDAWSVLAFAKGRPTEPGAVDRIMQSLANDPYGGVELGGIVQQSATELETARLAVLDRISAEHPASFSPLSLASLAAFAATRSWDEKLADAIDRLTDASKTANTNGPVTVVPRSTGSVSDRLAARRAAPLVGREAAVADVVRCVAGPDGSSCAVLSDAGAGRSAFLADVGAGVALHGYRAVYLAPQTGPAAAFGPFVQEVPELRGAIDDYLDGSESDAIRTARCFNKLLHLFERFEQPVCLVVDDVERLDSHSMAAIRFLHQSTTAHPIRVVAAVTGDAHFGPNQLGDQHQFVEHRLRPLGAAEMLELVGVHHPTSSATQRQHLMAEVLTLSNGLAGRAVGLVRRADGEMLLPESARHAPSSPDLAAKISPGAHEFAAAAGVLSPEFDLANLGALVQREVEALVDPIEELLCVEVLNETARPDVFVLADPNMSAELRELVPSHVCQRMHRRAADLVSHPMAHALHLDAARPLVNDEDVAASFLVAADAHLQQAGYREAVAAFRRADELAPSLLVSESLTSYATALDRAGSDGASIRRRAFDAALLEDDHAAALAAAGSGLPEAERLDGDTERIEMLNAVRTDRLADRDRFARTLVISRQLLLLGHVEESRAHVQQAAATASTIDDVAAAWLAERHIDMWSPFTPSNALRFEPEDVRDLCLRARVRQSMATSALIEGNAGAATEVIRLLVADTDELGDPLRSWHAGLLQTLLLDEAASFEAATESAERNASMAIAHGIAGAAPALMAQRVSRARFTGDPRTYFAMLERAGSDVMAPAMSQAVWARELGAAGFEDRARQVASSLLARPISSRFAVPIAGALAPVSRLLSDRERKQIWGALDKHRGGIVIMGAGVTSLGPAELLLAHACRDVDEANELRRTAVTMCEHRRMPLWQAMARLELALGATEQSTFNEAVVDFERLGLRPPEFLSQAIANTFDHSISLRGLDLPAARLPALEVPRSNS